VEIRRGRITACSAVSSAGMIEQDSPSAVVSVVKRGNSRAGSDSGISLQGGCKKGDNRCKLCIDLCLPSYFPAIDDGSRCLGLLLLQPDECLHGREKSRDETGLPAGHIDGAELKRLAGVWTSPTQERRGNQMLLPREPWPSPIFAELAGNFSARDVRT